MRRANNNVILHDTWVVFDICDLFLAEKPYKGWLRSIFYCLTKSSCNLGSYHTAIKKMIELSDSIVCGSREQQCELLGYNSNTHVVRDAFFNEFFMDQLSVEEKLNDTVINILWEGFSHGNNKIFEYLYEVMRRLLRDNCRKKFVIHFVTDLDICRFSGRFLCQKTIDFLGDMFASIGCDIVVHEWSPDALSEVSNIVDFALIPIPDDDLMMKKPENKLILLWYLNVPVICTDTPSYNRVMSNAGLSYCCNTTSDWVASIKKLISSSREMNAYKVRASQYILKNYSRESVLRSWFNVFEGSIL